MNETQHLYVQMMAACLHGLKIPRLPCRVKFFRDLGGDPSLMCVAAAGEGDDRQVVGVMYAGGAFFGPEPVREEARAELLAQFD